jgi:hypothetical protein
MASDHAAGAPGEARQRPYIQHTAQLARRICIRVAAGETLKAICEDADMPARATVTRWARESARFAAIYNRAKAFGARHADVGHTSTYCALAAHEIAVRVSEGETLSDIAADPAMPSMGTIFYWKKSVPEFADALLLAREAHAERLADLGWKMALAATPQTAHLTRVQLGQLRWSAAIKSPRSHGKHKASEPPQPPPGPTNFLFRHFHLERNDETGQHRVVTYTPDSETLLPVRDREGPWTNYAGNTVRDREPTPAQLQSPPPATPGDPDDDYWG